MSPSWTVLGLHRQLDPVELHKSCLDDFERYHHVETVTVNCYYIALKETRPREDDGS